MFSSVFYGALVPLFLFLTMRMHEKEGTLYSETMRKVYGHLFMNFTKGNYHWELLHLLQKNILGAVTVIFVGNPEAQAMCAIFTFVLALRHHLIVKPYICFDCRSGSLCLRRVRRCHVDHEEGR